MEENFSMQDKKEVYATLKSRLKKAIKNEFWFEACMIEYALIEDRSSSILYHAGIFGIEAHSEKKMLTNKLRSIDYQIGKKHPIISKATPHS